MTMKTAPQHLAGVPIPDIEIAADWNVSDITTVDDCNDAFAFLMSAIAQIEFQIDEANRAPDEFDPDWLNSAKCALKYKKAALQIVNQKRGEINDQARKDFQRERDRALLQVIRDSVPNQQFLEWLRTSEGLTAKNEAA